MTAYWLVKTEPDAFGWDQQVANGLEPWTGVRNFIARGNMKKMKQGEEALFYHTGKEKQVVGIVEVIREAYPDPTDEKKIFVAITVKRMKLSTALLVTVVPYIVMMVISTAIRAITT